MLSEAAVSCRERASQRGGTWETPCGSRAASVAGVCRDRWGCRVERTTRPRCTTGAVLTASLLVALLLAAFLPAAGASINTASLRKKIQAHAKIRDKQIAHEQKKREVAAKEVAKKTAAEEKKAIADKERERKQQEEREKEQDEHLAAVMATRMRAGAVQPEDVWAPELKKAAQAEKRKQLRTHERRCNPHSLRCTQHGRGVNDTVKYPIHLPLVSAQGKSAQGNAPEDAEPKDTEPKDAEPKDAEPKEAQSTEAQPKEEEEGPEHGQKDDEKMKDDKKKKEKKDAGSVLVLNPGAVFAVFALMIAVLTVIAVRTGMASAGNTRLANLSSRVSSAVASLKGDSAARDRQDEAAKTKPKRLKLKLAV